MEFDEIPKGVLADIFEKREGKSSLFLTVSLSLSLSFCA